MSETKVIDSNSIGVTDKGQTYESFRGSNVGGVDQFLPDITPIRKPPYVFSGTNRKCETESQPLEAHSPTLVKVSAVRIENKLS